LCAVIWHLLVSHPILQARGTDWERTAAPKDAANTDQVPRFTS
jgi:hypothetical protein